MSRAFNRLIHAFALGFGLLATGAATSAATPPGARVITLAPHITELMFAAGAGPRIIATVASSTFPSQATALPRVGDGLHVNAEYLIGLKPTHVLAWQKGGATLTLAPVLAAMKIELAYVQPADTMAIPEEVARLGTMFGTHKHAEEQAQNLRLRLQALRARYAHRPPVSVLIEIGQTPPYTLGNDPLTNDALSYCGAVNIYANTKQVAPQIQQEYVITHQPDMILVPAGNPGIERQVSERWQALGLQAARNQHVYRVDPDQLLRPGPRLVDAIEYICPLIDRVRQTQ